MASSEGDWGDYYDNKARTRKQLSDLNARLQTIETAIAELELATSNLCKQVARLQEEIAYLGKDELSPTYTISGR
jgi:predicted  nucleic acid-binding Zn-ribbon protein